jgi:hypothetical protein
MQAQGLATILETNWAKKNFLNGLIGKIVRAKRQYFIEKSLTFTFFFLYAYFETEGEEVPEKS